MIVEGLVTTSDAQGRMHVAPMGPHVDPTRTEWVLRPFQSSATFANLQRVGSCVFHVTDNALHLVKAVLGRADDLPHRGLTDQGLSHRGLEDRAFVLDDCCQWFRLRVVEWDLRDMRAVAKGEVEQVEVVRPFFGWNRAKHACVEGAILVSRIPLYEPAALWQEFERLGVMVEKTAGPDEREAFALLRQSLVERIGLMETGH